MAQGVVLESAQREQLRERVARHGEARAADALHIHRLTLVRALAGMPLRPSIAQLLSLQLREASP